jgi:hypothetical protein
MKAQILKIAGVKSEKEFYKKYPSEEAFMKQHSKAFKKAYMGSIISGGDKTYNPKMLSLKDFHDQADMDVTGMTDEMRQKQLAAQTPAASAAAPAGGGGGGLSSIMGMLGGSGGGAGGAEGGGGMEAMMGMLGGARYGTAIPRAQVGWNGAGSLNYGQPQQTYAGPSPQFQKPPIANDDNFTPSVDGYPRQGFTNQELVNQGAQITGDTTNVAAKETGGMEGVLGGIAKYAGPAGKLFEGYQALRGERRARKAAEQEKAVSEISLKASQTRPEEIKRKYVRPEDIQNTGEEFFPIYGVGTNPLARNGAMLQGGGRIGGNPTEIQNTYGNGNSLFDDLGYEPLTDPNQVKSFYHGGRLHQMADGGAAAAGGGTPWGAIGGMATNIGQTAMGGENAGGQIGSTIGSTVGSVFGPVGGAVGGFVGGIAGNALDTNAKSMKKAQEATKRNIQTMGLNSGFQSLQGQNQSYMKDGGYMNPEYNPQVITMFGDHNAEDFADYAHKFRAGGHLKSYTPPSERAMEIYEDGGDVMSYGLGGELQTHWGGGAETISQNPYLPGTGETVMFRGKSHEEYSPNGETGIGVTYGGNPVEVERGEPMVELEEGGVVDPETGEVQKSGVVFGNLKIPNQYLDLLGDKSAKGKKFKNYVADLSKLEEKQNKLIEKSTNELDGFTPITSFDKLKLTALQANLEGANMKLKDIADKKINAAHLQNAINDTAEEHGLVADDLARGKVKIDKEAMQTREARWGDAIEKAAGGKTVTKETTKKPTRAEAIAMGYKPDPKTGKLVKEKKAAVAPTEKTVTRPGTEGSAGTTGHAAVAAIKDKYRGAKMSNEDWKKFLASKKGKAYKQKYITGTPEVKGIAAVPGTPPTTEIIKTPGTPAEYESIETEEPVDNKSNWMNILNAAIPYFRPTDQEALDNAQLYPEMYALSSNQLEPVPTQGYQPELGVPYDISFQDQLNANQADYRAMQRMTGYNPAAQANLNAQKYQANQGILGNQFRANQEMKNKVYGENRNILNQAKLTNLGIYDKQYERQAEALSNTKATTLAALNSISDKYAKNKLENRTLGVYENLYNYRYDDKGRAINMNPLAQFDIQGRPTTGKSSGKGLAEGKGFSYDENGNIVGVRSIGKEEKEKNGKSIKAKNGSIVKSYKNL